jgi:hypothetical protein
MIDAQKFRYHSSRKIPLCRQICLYKGADQGERDPYANQSSSIRVPIREKETLMQANPPL